MMCTRHINPLRMIFDSTYLQTILDTIQQEVDEILVPLLKYKTKLLLDAKSVYDEMTDEYEDPDEDSDEDLDEDSNEELELDDEELDEGNGSGQAKTSPRKPK